MAKSDVSWEARRALTDNPNTASGAYLSTARELMDMNLLTEATIFFSLAGDKDSLREIINRAVAEGNFFVFKEASARLGEAIGRHKVQDLIASAEKNGRTLYAEKASEYMKTM